MSRATSPLFGRVIFAVGARRSGTNWIQRALAAHPDVVAVPAETYLFSHGLRELGERFHQGALGSTITGGVYFERGPLLDAMRDLTDSVLLGLMRGLDSRAVRIVERTPDHVRHLGLIREVYPDAHLVHIIRDGRDVVRSLLSQGWGPDQVEVAAEEWRSAVEAGRSGGGSSEHYHEVFYEQLMDDPHRGLVALFGSLGLSTDAVALDPVLSEMGVAYNEDPKAPAIATAKWRTGLDPGSVAAVERVAGQTLERFGYEPAGGSVRATPPPEAHVPPRVRSRAGWRSRVAALRRVLRSTGGDARTSHRCLDRFLGVLATDPGAVIEMLHADCHVRITRGDERYEQRGARALGRLVDELVNDDALRGRQTSGFVHPSAASVAFVGTFEHGGFEHPRVFVLTPRGEKIARVAYYRIAAESATISRPRA